MNYSRICCNSILAIVAILFFLPSSARSQCPTPLSWDYPGIPYNVGTPDRAIPISPTCTLMVSWCWRETPCCNDFHVSGFRLVGNCTMNEQDILSNLDFYIDLAATDVIANASPWSDDNIPECPTLSQRHWRQSSGGCFTDFFWKYDFIRQEWYRTSEPCDPAAIRYCWEWYQYCWSWIDGRRVLVPTTGQWNGGPPCPPAAGPGALYECHPVCP